MMRNDHFEFAFTTKKYSEVQVILEILYELWWIIYVNKIADFFSERVLGIFLYIAVDFKSSFQKYIFKYVL